MNKRFLTLCGLMLIPLFLNSTAFATGPATVYKVRVNKFEVYNGTNWITLFEGASNQLDIAAVNSGESAGDFLSGLSVPDGTYTQIRVTPSPTFVISGNDGANYTTAAVGNNGGSTPGAAAQQAECTITLTGANIPTAQTQDFSATPITVKEGSANRDIRVSFDVSNAIQLIGGQLYPAAPDVTMTVQ